MHPDARLDESREPQTLPHGENRWAYLIDASDLSLRHSFPICNCYTQSFATNFSSPEDGHCSLCAHLTSGTDNSCWISVDSEIQPSGQMHSANSQSLPSFVAKIHQIILRGRHLLVPPETTQELQHHQDEQQSLSHLDILFGRQILVERWVIGLEGVSASEHSKDDTSELVLLLQSLYSYLRLMPLENCLKSSSVLSQHIQFCLSAADQRTSNPSDVETSFDAKARLKVYKFNSVTTALGTLHLSVVYDASVADLLQSLPVHITTPMRSSAEHKWSHDGERLGSQSAMSVSPQSNSVANKMMMMDVDETDSTTEPTRSEWNDATPPRPSGSRSPFPSPTMVNNMRSFLSEKGKKMSQTASGLREGLALHLNTQKKLDTNVTSSPIQTHSFHPRSSLSESFTAGTSASNESSPQWMSDNELASLKEEDDLVLHSGATKPMSIPISPQRSPRGSLGLEDDLAFPPPREDAQDTTRMRKNLGLNISTHSSHQGDGLDLMAASFSPHRLLSPSPFSSELFGSFVGSYEQSILSGRMSTLPSKPIHFLADIGVVGFGKCKASLKCPPHKILAFPAYFYELENDAHLATPYVGNIDLEALGLEGDQPAGYRIPPKGQIQVMIRNQSRTPIKVFLVPYDFSDMPPNSKTFLRQKSYVGRGSLGKSSSTTTATPTGPVPPCISAPSLPASLPRSTSSHLLSLSSNASSDRLRYAIHLQVVCTDSRRLFLYKSIRVVFSHTTPETDQRLRVVCEGPSLPKYHVSDTVIKMSHLKTLSCSSKTGSLKRSSASSQGFGASGVMAMAGVSLTDYRVSPVVSTVTAEFGASKSGVVPGPLMRNGGGRLYSTTKRGSMSGLPPLPPQLPPPMAQGPDDVSSPTEGR